MARSDIPPRSQQGAGPTGNFTITLTATEKEVLIDLLKMSWTEGLYNPRAEVAFKNLYYAVTGDDLDAPDDDDTGEDTAEGSILP